MKKSALIRQRDLTDCGAACLASVCAHYGLFIPVSRIRQWAGTDRSGTSLFGLLQAAGKLELDAKAVKGTFGAISTITLPAIAHVIINESHGHYLVIAEILKNDTIVMDPAEGKHKKISNEEFIRMWTGVLVLMVPGSNFKRNSRKPYGYQVMDFARPHWKALLLATACAILFTVLGLTTSVYLMQIVDEVLEKNNLSLLTFLSLVMVGLLIMQYIAGLAKSFIVLKTSQAIDASLILGYFRHLLHLPQRFFDTMRVGEMTSRINDAIRINVFISEVVMTIVVDVLILLFSLAIMFLYYWKLAILILLLVPVYLILFYLSDRINKVWLRRIMKSGAELDAQLVHSLNAASTIKKLALEEYIYEKIKTRFSHLLGITRISTSKHIHIQASADFITRLFTVMILWTGCYFVMSRELTKGELLSFYALISYFTTPVLSLIFACKNIRDAMIAAERIFEITELESENIHSHSCIEAVPGDIEFRNVGFSYGNGEPVLNNINLIINKGSCTGIKGESGSGKSTFFALLLKQYRPSEGMITINGNDLENTSHLSLRTLIASVPQQTDLFHGSIRENICLKEFSDMDWLMEIGERLGINEFTRKIPEGYDTLLSEHGGNLSGGQKQMISIARALFRKAPILIMDEPTASLDEESENKIMQTIEWYKNKGNTVIIIAHKDSTLKICDNIVLLKNGRIVWKNIIVHL